MHQKLKNSERNDKIKKGKEIKVMEYNTQNQKNHYIR